MPTRHHVLMIGAAVLVFAQIVAFWPSSAPPLQPESSVSSPTDPQEEAPFPGFEPPAGASPDYGISGFHYVSVSRGMRQWKLSAREADFYSKDQWVYSRNVEAEMYTEEQASIMVRGDFARYSMETRNLDLGGRVVARFPDGTEIRTELLEFKPGSRRVDVPSRYRVRGTGPGNSPSSLEFQSNGMEGRLDQGTFTLGNPVWIQVRNSDRSKAPTVIRATQSVYRRLDGTLDLYSGKSRTGAIPVTLEQGSLKSSALQMQVRMNYALKKPSFVAREDVKIEEWTRKSRLGRPDRYSTCGRAEFDPASQEVVLSEYPQVYQDGDTMTGEVIRILRAQDQVEVENSNAFTRGRPGTKPNGYHP